jgi:hypothetical protein
MRAGLGVAGFVDPYAARVARNPPIDRLVGRGAGSPQGPAAVTAGLVTDRMSVLKPQSRRRRHGF